MLNLYQETLMDHYRHPRNRGKIKKPDFQAFKQNSLCGDTISIQGIVKDGYIYSIAFEGKGCVISQAAASLLTEKILELPVEKVQEIHDDFIVSLIGISLGPTRLKCALLSLQVLQDGLWEYVRSH